MISPSSSDSLSRTESAAPRETRPPAPPPAPPREERLSTEQSAVVRDALRSQPEIRPEVVARGKELAADKSYPPANVTEMIAKLVLSSRDISET